MDEGNKCKVQQNAINPNGQRSTMAGTTGTFSPPHSELNATKNIQIDPTSNLGAKRFDKD